MSFEGKPKSVPQEDARFLTQEEVGTAVKGLEKAQLEEAAHDMTDKEIESRRAELDAEESEIQNQARELRREGDELIRPIWDKVYDLTKDAGLPPDIKSELTDFYKKSAGATMGFGVISGFAKRSNGDYPFKNAIEYLRSERIVSDEVLAQADQISTQVADLNQKIRELKYSAERMSLAGERNRRQKV